MKLLFALLLASCVEHLPPPEVPAQVVPRMLLDPPPAVAGQGQVVLDTVNGPASVEAITGRETLYLSNSYGASASGGGETTMPVCTTPCVANLPFGSYTLRFIGHDGEHRSMAEGVVVGAKPTVYRYAVGRSVSHYPMLIGGLLLVVAGSGLGAGGIAASAVGSDAGTPLLITSGLSLAVGIVLGYLGRTEAQPGSGTQWQPADGVVYSR